MNVAVWTLLAFTFALTVDGLVTINADNVMRPSFEVDFEQNQFLLDGRPFRYVSGSFHYFRAPRAYWRDRLRKMRAAGLNAVSTYVEWSLHQPTPDEWNWEGDADLEHFLTVAQEEDLFVLLRPGPYICAERDMGGLPFWLLTLVPDIRLRTSDTRYMTHVTTYMNELMRRVKPFLRGNNGPVIMVQVENEYGNYYACDLNYTSQLRDILSYHVQSDALLYTTDGDSNDRLRCGMVPGVYTTVDFGAGSNVAESFATMRLFQPRGPFVCSEFYSGWITYWEEPFQRVNSDVIVKTLDEMLALGASVNIYMFYGGTNFGLTSGADTLPQYQPDITSYDYDAPLSEAGDLTQKYFAIKNVVSKYLPIPNITLPPTSPKGDYGAVVLEPILHLFTLEGLSIFGIPAPEQKTPPLFESFGIPLAFVLYETDLPQNRSDPSVLSVDFIHDRGYIYDEDRFLGILSRTHGGKNISLESPYGRRLKVFVENQGHVNDGKKIRDFKGIGNVTLNGLPLSNWNSTGFQLNNLNPLYNLTSIESDIASEPSPLFLRRTFMVPGTPLDTFLDTTGWGKGIVFINGKNLGRYWPAAGPQMTLYVPATFLTTGENTLVLLELEFIPELRQVYFQSVPNLHNVRRN